MTPRVAAFVDAVRRLTGEDGSSPSLRELGDDLGISLCATQRMARRAKEAGMIDWEPRRARSIRILALDEHFTAAALARHPAPDLRRLIALAVAEHSRKASDAMTLAALADITAAIREKMQEAA